MSLPESSLGDTAGSSREAPQLPRVFGWFDTTTLVVGSMIGSGIYLKASSIAQKLDHPGLILALWVICGLLTLFGSLTFAELGAMFPHSGGLYVYLEAAYGPLPAFLYGWSLLAILESGSIAGLAMGVVQTLGAQFGWPTRFEPVAAMGLIIAMSTINLMSSRTGAGLQNIFTVIKSVGLLLVIGCGLFLSHGSFGHLASPAGSLNTLPLATSISASMLAMLWAYDGWINASYITGEVQDAQRNLPRALLGGTFFVIVVYLLANAAYHYALPLQAVANSRNVARTLVDSLLGAPGALAMTLLAAVSTLGTLNGSLLTSSRVYYAMARNGYFFRAVAAIHPRYQTPHVAIIVQAAWAMCLLVRWQTFDALTDNVIFIYWIFYALGAAAVIVLRQRHPDLERPYRTPAYPWVPLVFLLGTAFLVVGTVLGNAQESREALYLLGLGLLVYPWFRSRRTA